MGCRNTQRYACEENPPAKTVQNLSDGINNEDKILYVFDRLCKEYTYDDNLLSYIKKVDDEVNNIFFSSLVCQFTRSSKYIW